MVKIAKQERKAFPGVQFPGLLLPEKGINEKEMQSMKKFRITIAEARSYKQFVCEIQANSEKEAREKAKKGFNMQYPEYMFHSKIIMCSQIIF